MFRPLVALVVFSSLASSLLAADPIKFAEPLDIGAEMSKKKYQVTGIPQAVIIDKQGNIRLIRVGSGEANAEALEETIREALDLKPETVSKVSSATPQVVAARPAIKVVGPQPPLAKAPFEAAGAKAHQEAWAKHLGMKVQIENSVGAKMVLIPPGEFMLGTAPADAEPAQKTLSGQLTLQDMLSNEQPQHRVVITKPLLIGATEVTIGQFRKFVEASTYVTEKLSFTTRR